MFSHINPHNSPCLGEVAQALLIFSGGQTRAAAGPRDEGGAKWENHGKTIARWWFFMGFDGIYPLVMTNTTMANCRL